MPPLNCPRIFCIGRNYARHIEELGDTDASHCMVFMKPPQCLVAPGTPIELPRDAGAVHHEVELVVRIGRAGRYIDRTAALAHVDALTIGLDLTLREVQNRLKAEGGPWEACKAFEQSAPLGEWTAYSPDIDLADIQLACHVNGDLRQQGQTCDMLFSVARLIAILSDTWRLQPGDLIFTGTPEGVGPITPGDTIAVSSPALGRFEWPIT